MEKVKQIFNIIFLFTSKQNTNKKIPCCRRLCAFDRPEGDAQKGAKHAYYMGGGNLAYLFLPVSCKNKWAKLEWQTCQRQTRVGKTKTQKRKRKEKNEMLSTGMLWFLSAECPDVQPGRITYNVFQARAVPASGML
jgi:hypothetical protein